MTEDMPMSEAEAGAPVATSTAPAERPAHVPERFWDVEAGAVHTEALLRAHDELERKVQAIAAPAEGEPTETERAAMLERLGCPADPAGYAIEAPSPLLQPDPELHARLHEAGFTQHQAQLVYQLAAEKLLPMIETAAGEIEASRDLDRLQRHFGGAEGWRGVASQLKAWGERHLEPPVYATLAASHDGILAMHEMMRQREPALVDATGDAGAAPDEQTLAEMMRDPRYWRDRDADFVARVTAGFRRLYPD